MITTITRTTNTTFLLPLPEADGPSVAVTARRTIITRKTTMRTSSTTTGEVLPCFRLCPGGNTVREEPHCVDAPGNWSSRCPARAAERLVIVELQDGEKYNMGRPPTGHKVFKENVR